MTKLFIGTSGWQYRDWKGEFYPSGLPARDELAYYAERFTTVEINSTFYHVPRLTTTAKWAEQTPDNDSPNRRPAAKICLDHALYVRFHGNRVLYKSSYTDDELAEWATWMKQQRPCEIWAYFNNDFNGVGPNNAMTLQKLLT